MDNRLLTIVFIDMQGYTRRSAGQTIEEMKLFHDQMFSFVSEIMVKWNGVMVKTLGDGFMVRFDSPTNAVQAGIEVQRRLESRNAQMMNPDSIVRFRIGINTGEVGIDEHGDLFGDPVNIASRIQTFADPNDVFISESTYLAMNRNEFGAVDLGSQELKNATREIKIYKILKNGAPGLTLPGRPAKNSTEPTGGTDSSARIKLVAAVIAVLLMTTTVWMLLKRFKNSNRKQPPVAEEAVKAQTPAVAQNEVATPTQVKPTSLPISEFKTPPAGNVDHVPAATEKPMTLLEINPAFPKLPLDQHGRKLLQELQTLRAAGKYDRAIQLARQALEDQKKDVKVIWAMILAELSWVKGEKEQAEKIFTDIKKRVGDMPLQAKKNLREQMDLIRSR
jgi:class 3 adenylate cyclase